MPPKSSSVNGHIKCSCGAGLSGLVPDSQGQQHLTHLCCMQCTKNRHYCWSCVHNGKLASCDKLGHVLVYASAAWTDPVAVVDRLKRLMARPSNKKSEPRHHDKAPSYSGSDSQSATDVEDEDLKGQLDTSGEDSD